MAKSPKKVVVKMKPSDLFSYFTHVYEVVGLLPDGTREIYKRCISLENATDTCNFVSRNHLFGYSFVYVRSEILWF